MPTFTKKKLRSSSKLLKVVPAKNEDAKPLVLELLSGAVSPGGRIHPYFTRRTRSGHTQIDFTINDTQRRGQAILMHGILDERGPLEVTVAVDKTPAVVGPVSSKRVIVYVYNHEDGLAYELPSRSDVSRGDEVSIYIDTNGRKAYWPTSQ